MSLKEFIHFLHAKRMNNLRNKLKKKKIKP